MDIDPFLFLKSANQPTYHPIDQDRVLYISNVTGLPQAWEYDIKKNLSYQLTFTKERIMFAEYVGNGNKMIVGMDE